MSQVRLGYCFTPYQRLWLYNGAPFVAFYDTLGIRRTYSRLKPPASSRGFNVTINDISVIYVTVHLMCRRTEEVGPTVGHPTPYSFRRVLLPARPSTNTEPPFLYGFSKKKNPPNLVAFYDTLGTRRTHSRFNYLVPIGEFLE